MHVYCLDLFQVLKVVLLFERIVFDVFIRPTLMLTIFITV